MNTPQLEISIKATNSGQARKLLLNRREISIGANLSNDIVLNGGSIKTKHCNLEIQDHPNKIIFHRKEGNITGEHGATIPDGTELEFETILFIGDNEFQVRRIDTPPLPKKDSVNTEDHNTNQYVAKENYADDMEVIEDTILDNSSEPQDSTEPESSRDTVESVMDFSPPLSPNKSVDTIKSVGTYGLPAFILGTIVLGLIFGGIAFYYYSNNFNKTATPTATNVPISTTQEASIIDSLRTILLTNDVEIKSVTLSNGRYKVEGYAKKNAHIQNAKDAIESLVSRNSIIYKLYSDEQIKPSVEMILALIEKNVSIKKLSYGNLELQGKVTSNDAMEAMENTLKADIPFIRDIISKKIMITDSELDGESQPFTNRIEGVWLGENPFLRMKNGSRYYVGDTLSDGRTVLNITNERVVLMDGINMKIILIKDL